MKKFLTVFFSVILVGGVLGFGIYGIIDIARAGEPAPAPRFKFGDQVRVLLPFYSKCSLGTVTELDPVTYTPALTHCYYVENIDCPYYNKDLHTTEYKRISLVVNEEDLQSKYHTMEQK